MGKRWRVGTKPPSGGGDARRRARRDGGGGTSRGGSANSMLEKASENRIRQHNQRAPRAFLSPSMLELAQIGLDASVKGNGTTAASGEESTEFTMSSSSLVTKK